MFTRENAPKSEESDHNKSQRSAQNNILLLNNRISTEAKSSTSTRNPFSSLSSDTRFSEVPRWKIYSIQNNAVTVTEPQNEIPKILSKSMSHEITKTQRVDKDITQIIEAVKRKTLKVCTNKSLNTMEHKKLRKAEKQSEKCESGFWDQQKLLDEEQALEDFERELLSSPTSNFDSKSDAMDCEITSLQEQEIEVSPIALENENIETSPSQHLKPRPRDKEIQDLMFSVQQNVSKILQEVDNEDIFSIASEIMIKAKNKANDEVDWDALAQQWIQMKETHTPDIVVPAPPPPSFSKDLTEYKNKYETSRELIYVKSETNNLNSLPSVTNCSQSQLAGSLLWNQFNTRTEFENQTVEHLIRNSFPSLPADNPATMMNTKYSLNKEYGSNYLSSSSVIIKKEIDNHKKRKHESTLVDGNEGDTDTDDDTDDIDAAKRKTLLEGLIRIRKVLEKMDRRKQKQKEKTREKRESEIVCHQKQLPQETSVKKLEKELLTSKNSRYNSKSDDEIDNENAFHQKRTEVTTKQKLEQDEKILTFRENSTKSVLQIANEDSFSITSKTTSKTKKKAVEKKEEDALFPNWKEVSEAYPPDMVPTAPSPPSIFKDATEYEKEDQTWKKVEKEEHSLSTNLRLIENSIKWKPLTSTTNPVTTSTVNKNFRSQSQWTTSAIPQNQNSTVLESSKTISMNLSRISILPSTANVLQPTSSNKYSDSNTIYISSETDVSDEYTTPTFSTTKTKVVNEVREKWERNKRRQDEHRRKNKTSSSSETDDTDDDRRPTSYATKNRTLNEVREKIERNKQEHNRRKNKTSSSSETGVTDDDRRPSSYSSKTRTRNNVREKMERSKQRQEDERRNNKTSSSSETDVTDDDRRPAINTTHRKAINIVREKMERKKLRQEEEEKRQKREQEILYQQRRLAKEQAMLELEKKSLAAKRNRFDSDSDDEIKNDNTRYPKQITEVIGKPKLPKMDETTQIWSSQRHDSNPRNEIIQALVLAVRKNLTESSLEVTNEEILSIVSETMNNPKKEESGSTSRHSGTESIGKVNTNLRSTPLSYSRSSCSSSSSDYNKKRKRGSTSVNSNKTEDADEDTTHNIDTTKRKAMLDVRIRDDFEKMEREKQRQEKKYSKNRKTEIVYPKNRVDEKQTIKTSANEIAISNNSILILDSDDEIDNANIYRQEKTTKAIDTSKLQNVDENIKINRTISTNERRNCGSKDEIQNLMLAVREKLTKKSLEITNEQMFTIASEVMNKATKTENLKPSSTNQKSDQTTVDSNKTDENLKQINETAKKKMQLDARIREGLEKMEREKQKQEENEKKIREKSQKETLLLQKSKFLAPGSDDDLYENTCYKDRTRTVTGKAKLQKLDTNIKMCPSQRSDCRSRNKNIQDLKLAGRKNFVESSLEITNKKTSEILNKPKTKDDKPIPWFHSNIGIESKLTTNLRNCALPSNLPDLSSNLPNLPATTSPLSSNNEYTTSMSYSVLNANVPLSLVDSKITNNAAENTKKKLEAAKSKILMTIMIREGLQKMEEKKLIADKEVLYQNTCSVDGQTNSVINAKSPLSTDDCKITDNTVENRKKIVEAAKQKIETTVIIKEGLQKMENRKGEILYKKTCLVDKQAENKMANESVMPKKSELMLAADKKSLEVSENELIWSRAIDTIIHEVNRGEADQNSVSDQEDWAAIAQEWIQMKEVRPPPMLISTPQVPSCSKDITKYEEKYETVMEVENKEKPQSIISQFNESSTYWTSLTAVTNPITSSSSYTNINKLSVIPFSQDNTGIETEKETTPPLLASSTTVPVTVTNPQLSLIKDYSSSHSSSSLSSSDYHKKTERRSRSVDSRTSSTDDDEETTQAFKSTKRETVPVWIKEGLEELEREKKKQEIKEREKIQNEILIQQKKLAEEQAMKELENESLIPIKSKFDSESDDEEIDNENHDLQERELETNNNQKLDENINHNDSSQDELIQSLMLAARKNLTEILLEVTNEEIVSIASETIKADYKDQNVNSNQDDWEDIAQQWVQMKDIKPPEKVLLAAPSQSKDEPECEENNENKYQNLVADEIPLTLTSTETDFRDEGTTNLGKAFLPPSPVNNKCGSSIISVASFSTSHIKKEINSTSNTDIDTKDNTLQPIDEIKTKPLPVWINEKLQKMERKEMVKSKEEDQQQKHGQSKPNSNFDDAEQELQSSSNQKLNENIKISSPKPRDCHSRDKISQDLMLTVRKTLTEILLEVTNEEILSIASETILNSDQGNRFKKSTCTI